MRNSLVSVFQSLLIVFAASSLAPRAQACQQANEVSVEMSNKTEAACGKRIVWDLRKFVPDDEICGSRRQGLNLIQRVLEEACINRVRGDDVTEKLDRIEVVAHLKPEFRYKMKARVLNATVPIKEAPVLSKWNESQAELLEFLRKSTGLKLQTKANREEAKATTDRLQNEKASEQRRAEQEAVRIARDAKRDAIYRKRDLRIAEMRSEMEAASATYVARTKEISARQGSKVAMSPEDIEQQRRDLEKALKELEAAQMKFQSGVQALTKEMDEALKAP